jgi:hypothetical protein
MITLRENWRLDQNGEVVLANQEFRRAPTRLETTPQHHSAILRGDEI